MLVTIHNLPVHIRYSDIKNLLQSKCGFSEVILDNLVNEGKTKKVTVGLPEEEDAAILTRNINGLYYDGRQLYVKDVRQKTPSDQPYHKGSTSADQPRSNYQQSNYQQSNYQQSNYQAQLQTPIGYPMQMNSLQDYQNYQAQGYQAMMAPMMDMPYYMQAQSAYMGYPGQGQTGATPQYSQFGQQERTQNSSGMGNDQNNRSRQWDNNEQSSYQNRQRSPSPSQGRSRWDNDRNRSRSPPRRGRSRDRGQRSPNRSDRGSYGNQGSRNEAYTSRGSFGGQNSGSSSNQAGPNRAAISPWESGPNSQNNARAQNPIEQEPQARNWERKAGPVMYNEGPSQNTWQRDRDNSSGGNSSAYQWNRSGSFQDSSQTSGFQNRQQNTWKRPNTDFDQSQPKRSRFDQQSQPSRFDRSGNSGPSGQNQRPQSQYQSGKNSNFRAGAAGNKNQPWNNQRPNQSPRNGNAGPSTNSKNSPKDIATYIRNDMANRNQACQELANKIRKVSPEFMADDNLVKLLRKAVRGRLECLLVDSIGITPKEMMEKYRKKFSVPSDNTLCNAIIKRAAEEAAAAEASATNAVPKEEEPVFKPPAKPSVATPTSGAQNKPLNKPAPVKQLPTFKAPEGGKLPTYPNADKRVYKNIKQLQKAEHRDDDFYKEEMRSKLPLEEEILVREVDAIVDIVSGTERVTAANPAQITSDEGQVAESGRESSQPTEKEVGRSKVQIKNRKRNLRRKQVRRERLLRQEGGGPELQAPTLAEPAPPTPVTSAGPTKATTKSGPAGTPGTETAKGQGKVQVTGQANAKRVRPNENSKVDPKRQQPSLTRDTTPESYAAEATASESTEVALTSAIRRFISRGTASDIEEFLIAKIDELPEIATSSSWSGPIFLGRPTYKTGRLHLICKDERTVQWLITNLAAFEHPDSILVIRVGASKCRVNIGVVLPGLETDVARVSKRLLISNPWADIKSWLVHGLERQERQSATFATFSIPEDVVPEIMARGRRLDYLLGSVYIKFRDSKGRYVTTPPSNEDTQKKVSASKRRKEMVLEWDERQDGFIPL